MIKIPDHKLPMSYFDAFDSKISPVKTEKIKNPRKKFKSSADVNQTADTSKTLSQPKKKSPTTSHNSLHTVIFREIDTDILVLLKVHLNFIQVNCP